MPNYIEVPSVQGEIRLAARTVSTVPSLVKGLVDGRPRGPGDTQFLSNHFPLLITTNPIERGVEYQSVDILGTKGTVFGQGVP